MLRVVVQLAYGSFCALFLALSIRFGSINLEISWAEILAFGWVLLSFFSLLSFLAPCKLKYLILAICSGCFLASLIYSAVVMASDHIGDRYEASAVELFLLFVTIGINFGMYVLAISCCRGRSH